MKTMTPLQLETYLSTTERKIVYTKGCMEFSLLTNMFRAYGDACQEMFDDALFRCKMVSEGDTGLLRVAWATSDEDGKYKELGFIYKYGGAKEDYGEVYYEGNPKYKFQDEYKLRQITSELLSSLDKPNCMAAMKGRCTDIIYFSYSPSYSKVVLTPSPRDGESFILTVVDDLPQNHSLGLDGLASQIRGDEDLTSNWYIR